MGNAHKMKRRSSMKPFIKQVNFNHLLPTRFRVTGEFAKESGSELKSVVTEEKWKNKESRKDLKKEVRRSSKRDSTPQIKTTRSSQLSISSSRNLHSDPHQCNGSQSKISYCPVYLIVRSSARPVDTSILLSSL